MTTEKGVAIRDNRLVALEELETRFAMAVRQRELLETYIKERLKPGKHFYHIDREEQAQTKPTLTKEGAELICLPHVLKPRYVILSGPENPSSDDTPYQITVNCELVAGEKFSGQGIGSANSHITKKDGTRIPRQRDPGLRHNATVKMACKSAYIAATLNATAASEFFTQDLDDDQSGGHKEEPAKKGHWCVKHQTAFFKKGKMKGYAHPIGDTGKWCNEEEEQRESTPEDAELTPADEVVLEASRQKESNIPHEEPTRRDYLFDLVMTARGFKQTATAYGWLTQQCQRPIKSTADLTDEEVEKFLGILEGKK